MDHTALGLDDLLVFAQRLADFEVLAFDNTLHMFDGFRFGHPVPESLADAKPLHQVVLEAYEESRQTRIPLPSRPAAQLVIDAPALVAICADYIQAAEFKDSLPL